MTLLVPELYGLKDIVKEIPSWLSDYDENIDTLEAYSPHYFVAEAGEDLAAGDIVCLVYDSVSTNTAKLYKAKSGTDPWWSSDTDSRQPAIGFIEKDYDITDTARCRVCGIITNRAWTLTPGSNYYLSSITAGEITSVSNKHLIGKAISAIQLLIRNKFNNRIFSKDIYCGSGVYCGEGYWSGS